MKFNRKILSVIVTSLAAFSIASCSNAESASQKAQTEKVIHDYLINNPEVVVQSLQNFQQKQADQARDTIKKTQENSAKFSSALFHQSADPSSGNPQGKITVVEFFDYQCPHCVDMVPTIEALVKSNPDVRIVYKEFPIRGPASEFAARAALAAQMQGKYLAFNHGLMAVKQLPLTEEIILKVAKDAGLNVDQLKTDMKSAAVDQQIKNNYQLAKDLQLMGTPALFVAKSSVNNNSSSKEIVFIPGQVDLNQLMEVVRSLK